MRTPTAALTALAVTASLGLAAVTVAPGAATASTGRTAVPSTAQSTALASTGAVEESTAEAVAATRAFLRTLSPAQRDTVVFDVEDPARRSNWTNLPTSVVPRQGLALGELTAHQRRAAMAILRTALSDQGYQQVQDVMAADDELARLQATGQAIPPLFGAPSAYGSDLYHLALFGQPSVHSPFAVQLTGHHLAQNITWSGGTISLAPEFVGTEPTTFDAGGRRVEPLAAETSAVVALVESLSEEQRAAAQIPGAFTDVALGAGHDGPFPSPEGVLVADLSEDQQDAVTDAVRAWVGDLDEAAADALVAEYVSDYDETHLGWAGGTSLDDVGSYVRIDGPAVWIELSTLPGIVVDQAHPHSVYRDETADYGTR